MSSSGFIIETVLQRILSRYKIRSKKNLIGLLRGFCIALWRNRPKRGQALWFLQFLDNTRLDTHTHTHNMAFLNKSSARRCGRYLNITQLTKQPNLHTPSGIRTRNPINQTTTDLRFREHDHRNRLSRGLLTLFLHVSSSKSLLPVNFEASRRARQEDKYPSARCKAVIATFTKFNSSVQEDSFTLKRNAVLFCRNVVSHLPSDST